MDRHILVDGVVFDTTGDLAKKVRKLLESHSKADRVGTVALSNISDDGAFIGFKSDREFITKYEDQLACMTEELNAVEELLNNTVSLIGHKDKVIASLDAEIVGLENDDDELRAECTRLMDLIDALKDRVHLDLDTYRGAWGALCEKIEEENDELRAEITRLSEEGEVLVISPVGYDEALAECTRLSDGIEHLKGQVEAERSMCRFKDAVIEAKIREVDGLRNQLEMAHDKAEAIRAKANAMPMGALYHSRDQYDKVQNYVIDNSLEKGHDDEATHADILISEHHFQKQYGINTALRAQAAEEELRALKTILMWAEKGNLSLDGTLDAIERKGIKI
jgi:chromosome segregation ATPase